MSAFVKAIGSVIPYPDIVVGLPLRELKAPSKASVIPYPAIVVGLLVRSLKTPLNKVGLPVRLEYALHQKHQ